MIAASQRRGIDLTRDVGRRPTARPSAARTSPTRWSRKGVVRDRDRGLRRVARRGRPGYVDRYAADLVATIALVRDAGGVTVVAHPWGRGGPSTCCRPRSSPAWPALGLAGVEVDHQDHVAADAASELRAVARDARPRRHRLQRLPRHRQDRPRPRLQHHRPRPSTTAACRRARSAGGRATGLRLEQRPIAGALECAVDDRRA